MTPAELAKRHHDELEAYNRTVCTGPIVDGKIKVAVPREWTLVWLHEGTVWGRTMQDALNDGISEHNMAVAIVSHKS